MANIAAAVELGLSKTKFESLLERKGSILVKVIHDLGSLNGAYHSTLELSTVRLFEPGNERNCAEGIKIEMREREQEGHASVLDMDEVGALLSGLEYMVGSIARSNGHHGDYTETVFSTRGDFSVGFCLSDGKAQAFLEAGHKAFVAPDVLSELASLLRTGQAHLAGAPLSGIG